MQITLTRSLHRETISKFEDARREIIQETRVRLLSKIYTHSQQPKQGMNFAEQQQYLAKLPHAAQATFNSSDKQHDHLCFQGTRVDVLDHIRAWALGGDEMCIFWLNGMAGTGKSTIVRTIAHEFNNQKCLGASFFFSRGTEDRSRSGKFFTTIAMQLGKFSPALKPRIRRRNLDMSNFYFCLWT